MSKRSKKAEACPQSDPVEVKSLKRELDNLRKRLRGFESGGRLIAQAVMEAYEDPPDLALPRRPASDRRNGRHHAEREIAVLHISDVHIGKRTKSYDMLEAESRMSTLVDKTIQIASIPLPDFN